MKIFERTTEYEQKLFELALFNELHIIRDASILILEHGNKLKAYCEQTRTYLQFPRALRVRGKRFIADIVEVVNDNVKQKYYRAMRTSIRECGSDEVVG